MFLQDSRGKTVKEAQEEDTVRQAMVQQIDTSGRHPSIPSHLV